MGLESVTHINDLVITNPDGATDNASQGDDHLRNIKKALKNDFPGLAGVFNRVVTKSGTYNAVLTDNHTTFICTGTWSFTFTTAPTLGDGWSCTIRNAGTGEITLDPDGSETINGVASVILPPGSTALVRCVATGFYAIMVPEITEPSVISGLWEFTGAVLFSGNPAFSGSPLFQGGIRLTEGTDIDVTGVSSITVPSDGNYFDIIGTGSPTITSIGAVAVGTFVRCHSTVSFTLQNSGNLILPTGANIAVVANDTFDILEIGTGQWRVFNYQRQNGYPLTWDYGLGYGQTWQDVTGSRSMSTVYSNSTNRPIMLSINSSQTADSTYGWNLYVGSSNPPTVIADSDFGADSGSGENYSIKLHVGTVVPAGHYYKLEYFSSLASIERWFELRA